MGIRGPRPFVPVGGSNRDKRVCGPFVPVGATNLDKMGPFVPVGGSNRNPGTKTTYCPGPKGCRDKWPETNTYSVVVPVCKKHIVVGASQENL